MNLYIRIKDGKPFEHPIFEDNMRQAFPEVDLDNLPPTFARFMRQVPPPLGPYQKNQRVQYELVGGVYTDVFYCDEMTAEEKAAKQAEVKAKWAVDNGFASWVFNEEKCSYEAPVPYPGSANVIYAWRESDTSWVYMPPPPVEAPNQHHKWEFDIETGLWKEVAA